MSLESIKELFKYRELLESLIYRSFISRYKQSVLGIAWAFGRPIAMAIIYTIVFSYIVRIPSDNLPYPIFVFGALLPWSLLATGLSAGVPSLVMNYSLVTKVYFPRELLPISTFITTLLDFGISMFVLFGMMIFYKINISINVWYVFPILFAETLLVVGLCLIFSTINVWFRDIQHALSLIIQLWMYLSPVIYPISMVPERYKTIYYLNPMVGILDNFRKVLLHGSPPDPFSLLLSFCISILIFIFGYIFFKSHEFKFADSI